MPKTPLLRSLFDLAKKAHANSASSSGELTRRQFLASSAAAASLLALPKIARGATTPRIAIVGAGISGLNCALTLADAGISSTVYEASGRIGGRMFSNTSYWNDGQVSEWCGELIDSGHKTIQRLAKRFGLALVDLKAAMPAGTEDTYWFFGEYYTVADANADFQPVHRALVKDVQDAGFPTTYASSTPAGVALDNMSIYDWIESRVPGGHKSPLGMLLDVAYNIEYGAETTDQSALNLVYLLGYQASPGNFAVFGASDERYHVVGGNQQIPVAIANYLNNVSLGWRMTAISKNPDGTAQLDFQTAAGAKSVTADHVVLALPFAVLRTLDFSRAGFDTLKTKAINEQGASRNGKLQLQFQNRLWNQAGAWPAPSTGMSYADTGYQNTWEVSRGQPGKSGILVDYTGGNTTLAMKTNVAFTTAKTAAAQFDANRFLYQIEPVYAGLSAQWNGLVTSSIPHLDPNFKLAYSYWRVGQYHTFAGYERVPQGNVHFAGEHTSIDYQGYMEGGADEGDRAAKEVLAALGVK
jgi:monoamine oxidase